MKYERFEELPVWNAAIGLGLQVYGVTRDRFFQQPGDFCDQLRRAALSVSNNIAEGFERGSTAELIAFLYISRGSAGEVRSALHFAERLPGGEHLKSQISNLRSLAESCSRQLRAWLAGLLAASPSRTARSEEPSGEGGTNARGASAAPSRLPASRRSRSSGGGRRRAARRRTLARSSSRK